MGTANGAGAALKRRGILAAAGAAVAGLVAKQSAQPVLAASLTLDSDNDGLGGNTNIHGTGNSPPWSASQLVLPVFSVNNTGSGTAFAAKAVGNAIYAESSGTPAVIARVTGGAFGIVASTATGLYGVSGSTGSSAADAAGVSGSASSATGVRGSTTSGMYGVYGLSQSSNGVGVAGTCANGTGVQGSAAGGIGVYGVSTGGYGILGVSGAGTPYSGVTGAVYTASGAAFAGGATQSTAYAAYFTGKVNIDGPLLVNGTQRFTLTHADGTSRLVASIQSPEAWVEDFGRGTLTDGAASVALDADFRDVADTSDYHVFLTMYDAAQTLYVTGKGANGFVVRAQDASASGLFSYRVLAKPRGGGGKMARLAKYEPPDIRIPGINGAPLPPAVSPATPLPPEPSLPKDPRAGGGGPDPLPPSRPAAASAASPMPAGAAVLPIVTSVPPPAPPPRP